MKIIPYLKIIRIQNTAMTGVAVLIGNWIAQTDNTIAELILLIIAATTSIGFGNVINDIVDIKTDLVSHPNRPLPKGDISKNAAIIYSVFLFCISVVLSFSVSAHHAIATCIPLVLLIIYSLYLKSTPLTGNILVALLVAYPVLYGGLNGRAFSILLIPATLAFLLNFSREIVKDIEDRDGDLASGLKTSASLSPTITKSILLTNSASYLLLLFLPVFLQQFGWAYALICLFVALPVHFIRTQLLTKKTWPNVQLNQIASLYKIEMLCGLAALLGEKISHYYFK